MTQTYPVISFEEAFADLQKWDWENDRLEELLIRLGCGLPPYFQQTSYGGIDLQQIPSEISRLIKYFWVHHPNLSSYLEVGVGKFGTFLVLNESWKAKKMRPDLYIADDFSQDPVVQAQRWELVKSLYSVTGFVGRTTEPAFKEFVQQRLFEVIFIDADHSFAGCISDLVTCYPRIAEGGTVVMHDVTSSSCPGVVAAFEFAKRYFGRFELYSEGQGCGIGVLSAPKFKSIPEADVRLASMKYKLSELVAPCKYWAGRAKGKLARTLGQR